MKKNLLLFICIVIFIFIAPCMAEENPDNNETEIVNSETSTDVIITRYRYFEGHNQYRRWNVTKQIWVDPYWINLD